MPVIIAITVSVQTESGHIAVYAGFDFLYPIRFRSSKDGLDQIVQNWPESDLGGLVRFWPNGSGPGNKPMCKNHRDRFRL